MWNAKVSLDWVLLEDEESFISQKIRYEALSV